nr:dihydrofolate reductase family protein [Nocardioides convexus]
MTSWEGPEESVAAVLEHQVGTKEVWLAAIEGGDVPSRPPAFTAADLLVRHDAVAPRWLAFVRDVDRRGGWDDLLVDALCEPPESLPNRQRHHPCPDLRRAPAPTRPAPAPAGRSERRRRRPDQLAARRGRGPMTTTYYTATTLDGFIADPDDSLAWLLRQPQDKGGAQDYDAFYRGIGALVMGSTTYEWVLAHLRETGAAWFYDVPTWVLSTRTLPSYDGADVRFASGPVAGLHPALTAAAGERGVWVVGGGDLAGQFADAGLLDEVVVSIAPLTLGAGRPLLPRRLEPAAAGDRAQRRLRDRALCRRRAASGGSNGLTGGTGWRNRTVSGGHRAPYPHPRPGRLDRHRAERRARPGEALAARAAAAGQDRDRDRIRRCGQAPSTPTPPRWAWRCCAAAATPWTRRSRRVPPWA